MDVPTGYFARAPTLTALGLALGRFSILAESAT